MKNFNFLAFFCFTLASTPLITAHKEENLPAHQTPLAYLSSYIWQEQKVDPIPASSKNKVIIFDLDGVLCTTDTLQAFQEIGIATIMQYIVTEWKLPSKTTLFKALETTPEALSKFDSYHDGMRMPDIMVDLQVASQSLVAIQLAMNRQIKNSTRSDIEKTLLLQTVDMMTTPEKFIKTRTTISAGVELLHELKAQGYKLYVLSNWDASSFSLLQTKFPKIFKYNNQNMFDGIMTSGDVGILKPDIALFEKCLDVFKVQASDAIFIDDTIENINAAKKISMKAIHCNPDDIGATRKKLIEILEK